EEKCEIDRLVELRRRAFFHALARLFNRVEFRGIVLALEGLLTFAQFRCHSRVPFVVRGPRSSHIAPRVWPVRSYENEPAHGLITQKHQIAAKITSRQEYPCSARFPPPCASPIRRSPRSGPASSTPQSRGSAAPSPSLPCSCSARPKPSQASPHASATPPPAASS